MIIFLVRTSSQKLGRVGSENWELLFMFKFDLRIVTLDSLDPLLSVVDVDKVIV
jgi:hypothetical protein